MTRMDRSERACVAAELAARLGEVLGGRDAGNGTQLADVVASAIMEDVQTAAVGAAAVRALGDQALLDVAENLHRHIHRGSRGFTLPFGTKVNGAVVEIEGQRLMLDAGRPGLHPFESLSDAAHGHNLALLLELLEGRMPHSRFPALGLPRSVVVDGLPDAPGLEFPPIAEVAGVTLRHSVSQNYLELFCSLGRDKVKDLADDIVRSIDRLWQERDVVASRVRQVRQAVLARLEDKYGTSGPVSLRSIGIDYSRDDNDDWPYLYVEYDALDQALRPGSVIQDIHGRGSLSSRSFRIDDWHDYRSRQKAELDAVGAIGRVMGLAADLIRAAPEGERAVLERLGQNLETRITVPGAKADLHGTLWWSSGSVHVSFAMGGKLKTSLNGVEFRGALPHSVMAAATGRLLHEIVELPFDCGCRIEKVEPVDRNGEIWTDFALEEAAFLIDGATGTLGCRTADQPWQMGRRSVND